VVVARARAWQTRNLFVLISSNPIYVSAGTGTINFSYFLMYGGTGVPVGGNPDGVRADSLLVFSNSGNLLATLPIVGDPAFEHERSGTMTWTNPVDQFIKLGGDICASSGNKFGQTFLRRVSILATNLGA
jgi:hypothetical protein